MRLGTRFTQATYRSFPRRFMSNLRKIASVELLVLRDRVGRFAKQVLCEADAKAAGSRTGVGDPHRHSTAAFETTSPRSRSPIELDQFQFDPSIAHHAVPANRRGFLVHKNINATPPMARADEWSSQYHRRLLRGLQRRLSSRNEFADPEILDGLGGGALDTYAKLIRAEAAREAARPSFDCLPKEGFVEHHRVDATGARTTEWHGRESFIKALNRPGQRVARARPSPSPGFGLAHQAMTTREDRRIRAHH